MRQIRHNAEPDPSRSLKIRRGLAAKAGQNMGQLATLMDQQVAAWPQDQPIAPALISALTAVLLAQAQAQVSGGQYDPYVRAAYLRGLTNANLDLRAGGLTQVGSATDALAQLAPHQMGLIGLLSQSQAQLMASTYKTVATVQAGLMAEAAGGAVATGLLATGKRLLKSGARGLAVVGGAAVVGVVAEAFLNRLADFGIALVSPIIEAKFTTAGDERVCARCLGLEEADNGNGPGVYTLSQARGLLPVHYRCRCTWRAVIIKTEIPFLRFR